MTTTMTDLASGKTYLFNEALPGRDAYEEALSQGFIGTRAEWVASLRGLEFDPDNAAWENDRAYPPRAAVIHANSFWFAAASNQGAEPGVDAVWVKLVHGEDAAALTQALTQMGTLRDEAALIASAAEDQDLGGGTFSANHHRLKAETARYETAALKTNAEAALDAKIATANGVLDLTVAASEALTPISALHDLAHPIPAGWWDTGERQFTTSIGGVERVYAVINNFNPASLFTSRLGPVYDPSIQSSLWQDDAGTTPVTALGQVVGRIDDLSGNGTHASTAVPEAKPVWARHPWGGRRNLLTHTEDLTTAAWISSVSPDTTFTTQADDYTRIEFTATSTDRRQPRVQDTGIPPATGDERIISARFRPGPGVTTIAVGVGLSSSFVQAAYDTLTDSWSYYSVSSAGTMVGVSAVEVSPGVWDIAAKYTAGAGPARHAYVHFGDGTATELRSASPVGYCDVTRVQAVDGAVERPYQKAAEWFDVTEAGKPDVYYLHFDGVDDVLTTANVAGVGGPFLTIAGLSLNGLDGSTGYITAFGASFGAISRADIVIRASGGGVGDPRVMVRVAGGTQTLADGEGNTLLSDLLPHLITGGYQDEQVFIETENADRVSAARVDATTYTGSLKIGMDSNESMNFYGGMYLLGDDIPASDVLRAQQYFAAKTGVEL